MRKPFVIIALLAFVFATATLPGADDAAAAHPNIIWIVGDDLGPELGCYGDTNSITPNLDRFAREGARFTRAFTHAPVCAPARSGLITGMYPTSMGSHHMRSELLNPPRTFTSHLRELGYFVAWPGKTDFNFKISKDAFDSTANWRSNTPRQPFFAYVNLNVTHESQLRATRAQTERNLARLKPNEFRDPSKMVLPPYHPDTPDTRRDLANYYNVATALDYQVGDILRELDEKGLATNTIVVFFGDHGRGLPRSKRWIYDSGAHVPLLVRWPGQIKPGTVREDLVSFIDFAPTMLALAGAPVPTNMHGQVFLGAKRATERKYVFAARDRMDEALDRIRSVRSKDFHYIRNFRPELPYAQRIDYMEEMPTMRVWRQMNLDGKLNATQKLFFQPSKPAEEFYDVNADPHEVRNLATDPKHLTALNEHRAGLEKWIEDTHDMGAISEQELIKRGIVADKLTEYEARVKPLEIPLK
ncbi:MAG TPA: sulfatase [Candidatus Acidoferrum sp.]|nr:sulfatase [Candidatus Acidoferrum sp.]